MPRTLLGRRSVSMTLWAWFSIWGFPSLLFVMTILPYNTVGSILSVAMMLFCLLCFWWTAGLVERARWILMIQSCSPDGDPDEQWWKRLMNQFGKLSGQSRLDTCLLKSYAYWPWLLMNLWGYLWGLLRRITRKPKGRIRLDEEVPLQLSGGLGNVGAQGNSGLQEGTGPSQSGPSEEAL